MKPIQIVATIGPSTKDSATTLALIKNGMSIARLNFSHGTHTEHRRFIKNIRTAATKMGSTIPIIQDLSGPRIQQGAGHTFDNQVAAITEKDKTDFKAIADLEPEYIALSFVKEARDITDFRNILTEANSITKIIAKIERPEAIVNLENIIATADGIMIARGDLGDTIPFETIPFVTRDILKYCNQAKKPAIVATEMLSSMVNSTNPSRADVSDIAHAVLDGTSATMLSNETAVGDNPIEAVAVMRTVVTEASRHTDKVVESF